MLLHLRTWPEVEAYLKTSTAVILPIGSTEQHGPNGMIGTDAICAEVIGRRLGDAVGAMVGPTIGVGMAEHHMQFAGSITYRPSTLIAVVRDHVLSLAAHGFTRFFFVNGHGGNVATVRAAFYETYAELRHSQGPGAPEVRCALANWWENAPVGSLSRELFGAAEGGHATPSEVSVVQHAYAEALRDVRLDPAIAPSGSFYDSRDFRRRYPDGRIGSNPGLARPEHGARLVEAAVQGLSDQYRRFIGGE